MTQLQFVVFHTEILQIIAKYTLKGFHTDNIANCCTKSIASPPMSIKEEFRFTEAFIIYLDYFHYLEEEDETQVPHLEMIHSPYELILPSRISPLCYHCR